jgi:hypothetical protein
MYNIPNKIYAPVFQYLALGASVASGGGEHRKGLSSNRPLCALLTFLSAFSVWLVIGPLPDILRNFFELIPAPDGKDR